MLTRRIVISAVAHAKATATATVVAWPKQQLRAPVRQMAWFNRRHGYEYFAREGQAAKAAQRTHNTRLLIAGGVVALGGLYYVSHLETVPVSGRRRFNNVSPESERAMGEQAYLALLKQYHGRFLNPSDPRVRRVKGVGERIAHVSGLPDAKWEFFVIDSEEINAFVIPGGKVFVFTGILPIMANDDGIAAVLGHEIAHQVARHSAERLSIAQIAMFFNVAISLIFSADLSSLGRLIFTLGYELPYSRSSESEADYIGLLLMAQACFDPTEAIHVWKRMDKVHKDTDIGKFLSTHPSNRDRIKDITKWLPEANLKREQSDCSMRTTSSIMKMLSRY